MKEFFPSWDYQEKHLEVLRFTCGLMSDPSPLVDHLYGVCVEKNLHQMRTEFSLYTTGIGHYVSNILFPLLYEESAVALPGNAFHNLHINYNDHHYWPFTGGVIDNQPICTRSRLYIFKDINAPVILNATEPKRPEGKIRGEAEGQECAIYITGSEVEATKSLLSACSRISGRQPVSDLMVVNAKWGDAAEPMDAIPIMSKSAASVTIQNSTLPPQLTNGILDQLTECSTLCRLDLNSSEFKSNTKINISNSATTLTHLDLGYTQMSPQLNESVCKQLAHVIHLTFLSLDNNNLGDAGHHLAESISSWGPDPPLEYILISRNKMPTKACARILSVLSRCKRLHRADLPGNTLRNCLSNFVPEDHPGLHSLQELNVQDAALKKADLDHIIHLIVSRKLPGLKRLVINLNSEIEAGFEELKEACVTHHQRELKLLLGGFPFSNKDK